MRSLHALSFVALTLCCACARRDPWAPCRDLGPVAFRAMPPACTSDACRACAAALEASWQRRAERDEQVAFRARFMRVASDARDAFATRARPDGSFAYEHCTVGVDRSASCAAYSPYCVDVIARGLHDGETALGERAQYTLAASHACPSARAALVEHLTRCAPIAADDRCESGACATCASGRLAALSVLIPIAEQPGVGGELQAIIDATPEPVARSLAEVLGAPDAPADVESVVVQRALRHYCFSLVARSAAAPPFACNGVMVRFLTHPEYGDASRSWEALERASGAARAHVLGALMVDLTRRDTIPEATLTSLRALPAEGTTGPIAQGMLSAATTEGAWRVLRAELVRRGVTGAALPPVNRPSTPGVAPAVAAPPPRAPAAPGLPPRSEAPAAAPT